MSITTTTTITAVADNKGTIQGNLTSGGVTDDTSLALSGTISVALVTGQVVAVYDGATKLGNATVSGTTWSYTDFTLANGDSVSYTAQVEDGVSQGPASAAFTTTIDNVPSTTTGDVTGVTDDFGSVTGSIAQGGSTDDHTPLISGTLSTSLVAGESVHVYRTLIGGTVVDAGVATVSGTTWSFSDTISTEGAYRYQARVLDAAGNVGSSDTAYNINVTVAAVAAPVPVVTGVLGDTGQSATDGITNDTTLYITGTGIVGATVTVYKNAVSIGTTTADFLGRWQFDYTGTTLAQGTYNFTAQQTDLSGNVSPVSTAFTATIDTTPPATTAIISTVEDDEGLIQGNLTSGDTTDDTSLVLTGTISAPLAAGEIVGIYDGGTRAGAQPVRLGTATMLDDSTWTFTDSTLGNGLAVSYTAQVEDVAGNGNASAAFAVTIDTSPPPVPAETVAITAVADNVGPIQGNLSSGGFTDDTSLVLSGTISSTLLAGEVVAVYDGATRLGNAVVSGTTWTYTDATLADGDSVSYTVLVENAAGQGTASAAFTVNIDTTAPAASATITSVTDDVAPVTGNVASGGFTNDSTPLIGGTLSASLIYGESVHVFRDGVDVGTATVSGTTWTFSDTLATDGSYSYTAQVQDIAGNVSALSAAYSITEVGTASVPVNPEPLTYINFDFSAPLNAAFTPTATDFVGKLNAGGTFNPSSVNISGNVLSLGVTAAATDVIEFSYIPGTNPLQDNAGNLTGALHLIAGGSNADTLNATYTTAGVDYVWGGDGNDTITGGGGADILYGDNGNDTFIYATLADFVTGGAVVDSITGGAGTDKIQVAGAISLATTDTLARVNTVEQLVAASSGSNLAHSIVLDTNAKLGSITTVDLSANTGATSTAVINMTGVTTAMTLTGVSAGHNTITGGDGNDTITGSSGNDSLSGGNGNDTFVFASSASLLNVVSNVTTYTTTYGYTPTFSTLETYISHPHYYPYNSSGDVITGGAGTDKIQVGGAISISASDSLASVSGVEQLVAASSGSNLAHSIVVSLNANLGSITTIDLSANTGATSTGTINLTGVTTAMTLTGVSVGHNTITGGSGNDTITGGSGTDTLDGGSGNDTFVYATMTDFVASNAVVDSITGGAGTADKVQVAGAITLTTSDTLATRLGTVEQLVAASSSSNLTHSIVLDTNTKLSSITTIDLSANTGATSTATINLTGVTTNMTLIGVSAGTNTITSGSGNDSITGGSGNDTFNFVAGTGLTSGDTVNGGAGTDTLNLTGNTAVAATNFNNVSNIENFTLANTTTNVAITTVDALVASGATLTLNASSLTTGTLTFNGAAETNGVFSITGGAGNDTITGSNGNDTITGGLGNDNLSGGNGDDTFTFAAGTGLTSGDTVNGGAGTDTVALTGNTAVAATDFNNVSNIEIITLQNTTTNVAITTANTLVAFSTTLTLNASNLTTGTLNFNGTATNNGILNITGGAANDTITGGANNDTITGGSGADTLDGGSGDDTFVYATMADFVSSHAVVDSITGGAGTADKVQVAGNITLTTADTLATRLGTVEQLVAAPQSASALVHSIVLDTNAKLSSITTIDLSGDSNAGSSATINLTGVTTASMTLIGVSAGTNTITGSAGANVITGGSGVDILNGGAGNDTITGGDGNDTITGGSGVDALDGGNGDDTFTYATIGEFITAGGAVIDTVTGGAGNDKIQVAGAMTLTTANTMARVNTVEQLVAASSNSNLAHSIVVNTNAKLGSVTAIDLSANTGATSTGTINMTGVTTAMALTGVSVGHNTITGGSGADTITGGSGTDTLDGGSGNDTFVYAAMTDFVSSHAVVDSITGGSATDKIQVAGAITLTTADTLATRLVTVEQLVAAPQSATALAHSIVLDTNTKLSSITTIDLSGDSNVGSTATINLTGVTTSMTLKGVSAGTNTITAGSGNDSIIGGSGNDTFNFAAGTGLTSADTVNGGAGTDTLNLIGNTAIAATNFNNVSNIEAITLQNTTTNVAITTTNNLVASGATLTLNASGLTTGALTFNGAAETNSSFNITGGAGNDSITGGSLSDTITGGAGVDVLDGGSGSDTFVYATMADFVSSHAVVDSITGGTGTDAIQVAGAITLTTSDNLGTARLTSVEQLIAASESTTPLTHSIVVNSNTNLGSITTINLSGDTNFGSHATIDLTGVSTNMTISGTKGADTLTGGSGNDTFVYNSSADFFAGGVVVDSITGGGGTDKIQIGGGISINGSLASVNTVEQLVAATQSAAALTYNIVINSDANLGSITTIDLSGDTNTGSSATVDLTGVTTAVTILGVSAGTNHLTGGTTTSITGGSGNDTIAGGTGNDSLSGGGGNDTFTFTAGTGLTSSDTVDGGNGIDTVVLTGNTAVAVSNFNNVSNIEAITLQNTTTNVAITTVDALVAAGATLTLNASSLTTGTLTFNGAAETDGNFNITGGAGNDTLTGGAGNDTLTGGAGVDVLNGGNGNDTFAYATMAAFYTGGAVIDSINGGAGTDRIQVAGAINLTTSDSLTSARLVSVEQLAAASSSSNLAYSIVLDTNAKLGTITTIDLSANTGATSTGTINMTGITTGMTLTGVSAGTNTITGGSGNDSITGGSGNDRFNFAAGTGLTSGDTVNGGAGTDTVALTGNTAVSATDFNNVSNVEIVTLANTTTNVAITAVDALVASGATLTLSTSLTTGTLNFNGAAETNGAFSISGGAANDTITGGSGDDTIAGGTGNDSLSGGNGNDTFTFTIDTGLTSADTVDGGAGYDTVILTGGASTSHTNDFDHVSNIESIILSQTNNPVTITTVDTLVAAGATLTLSANGGSLNFNGAAETDGAFNITGSAFAVNDTIIGGAGNDTITGGLGNDSLSGGNGNDTFVFAAGTGLTSADTVNGGAGTDTVALTGNTAVAATNFDNVSNIEAITLGNTNTGVTITTKDGLVAAGAVLTLSNAANSGALTFNGSVETDGAFSITGGSGNDNITGGSGNDTITFAAVNLNSFDTVNGGAGTDTVALTGNTAVASTAFNNASNIEVITLQNTTTNVAITTVDALVASGATLTLSASSLTTGTLNFNGAAETNGAFSITGGAGNDTIAGGAGVDILDGGNGNDTFVYATMAAFVTSNAVVDSITGGAGTADKIQVAGAITLTTADSLARVNTVEQLVAASSGSNLAHSIVMNSDANLGSITTIDLSANTGATSTGTIDMTGITTGMTLTGVSAGHNTITGGSGNDTITGGSGSDSLIGGSGNNTITGGGGNDTLTGGSGNDTFVFASSASLLNTSSLYHSDFLGTTYGPPATTGGYTTHYNYNYYYHNSVGDIITGGGGTDQIQVAGAISIIGTTYLSGGSAIGSSTYYYYSDDTLANLAGSGVALLAAASSSSNLAHNIVLDTNAKLGSITSIDLSPNTGAASTATIDLTGVTTAVTLTGVSVGVNNITGGSGADSITGGSGADSLVGGNGADTLIGGGGADTINLTETVQSTDTVKINASDSLVTGQDQIHNFNAVATAGQFDQLNLPSTTIAANGAVNGTDISGILSHSVTSGMISFDNVNQAYTTPIVVNAGNVAAVDDYLATNIASGQTVAFYVDANSNGVYTDAADYLQVFQGGATPVVVDIFTTSGLGGVTALGHAAAANTVVLV